MEDRPEYGNASQLAETKTGDGEIASLIPTFNELVEAWKTNNEYNYRLQKSHMKVSSKRYSREFGLTIFIIGSFLLISAGLIFLKDDSQSGFLLLSHLGAALAGLIGGMGWEKARE